MKILYDHQIFSFQNFGGISRYFTELINLTTCGNINVLCSVKLTNNNYFLSLSQIKGSIDFLSFLNFKGKTKFIYTFNKIYSILMLKFKNYDIFHPTYYDPYFLRFLGQKEFVLTVHDMIHEKFPEIFGKNDNTAKNKKLLIKKASKIIAISENTKKDLVEILNVDPKKITVVYHGNSMISKPKLDLNKKYKLPDNYLLFVGSRSTYKNFIFFVKSIKEVLDRDISLNVVCVGGGEFIEEELNLFKEYKIMNRFSQYKVDDKSLSYFYSNAKAFIFPSIYEGFGLPILESFSCGCPLICSNTSSFPEIASDAAVYFDPMEMNSIQNAVIKVIYDSDTRLNMIKKGYDRANFFSWDKTANSTNKIYKSILR